MQFHLSQTTTLILFFVFSGMLYHPCHGQESVVENPAVLESADAVLQIVETRLVPAQASGQLNQLTLKEGDLIAEGEVVARIQDNEERIKLQEAEIELEIASERMNSNLEIEYALKSKEVAAADYERALASNRRMKGVVSDTEIDRLRLVVEKNDAELKKIEFEHKLLKMNTALKQANLDRARNELDKMTIRSQMAGQVIEVNKRQGEWVEKSEPVIKVIRLDRLRVEIYIPSQFATSKLLDCPSKFQESESGRMKEYDGKVVFIDPEVNPLNSQSRIWIEIENPNLDLRPGIKGDIAIELPKPEADSE